MGMNEACPLTLSFAFAAHLPAHLNVHTRTPARYQNSADFSSPPQSSVFFFLSILNSPQVLEVGRKPL